MSGEEEDPSKTSSGEDDDDFVSCDQCQIMFDKNDKSHELSECFERCHFFCPPCIQLLMAGSCIDKKFVCPLCRLSETEDEKSEQLWCFDCNVPASIGCYEENHTIQKYEDLFNARSLQLKCQINQTNSACDDTLKNCHQIQSVHQVILAWMQWLLREITQWDSSNNATIAQLESLKASEGFCVQQEKNLQCTINKINQLIVQSNDRFQEVQASKLKVSELFHTYSSCSQQTSSIGSAELMKLFSTSLNQTNQSCINVLAFLISFLGQGENRTKESEQVLNDVADKVGMPRTGQFLKRRLEEDPECTVHVSKKARKESSVLSELKTNLSSDFLGSNCHSPEFNEAMELYLAEVNEKRTELVRELEKTQDMLKLSEERAAVLVKEAEQKKDLPNQIARLEADLELMAKKVEQSQESELKANREALNQKERAKETQEKYEIELNHHAADVEQLKNVCEQLVQSKSQVANVLWELTNHATPGEMKKLQRDKELLQKRLEQAQMELEKMKEVREKITIHVMTTNAELMTRQTKLTEEIRLAKEETRQLKLKSAEAMVKHLNELHNFRDYKTQLEELKIKYDKLVNENEKCCANLAASQAEQIKSQEIVKIKFELEKAKQDIEKLEINKPIKPIQIQIHYFNALVTDLLAELHNKKESDWFVYSCSNCKSRVEMGFHCGECENFQLCILCHKKDEHQHKMDQFGFDLDRNKSSSPSMDLQEARKSRVDRRILSLVHSFNCSVANCVEPFCRTMKTVIAHHFVCYAKSSAGSTKGSCSLQIRCVVCRQLVGLFILHANRCSDLECKKPYCSNVKKKMIGFSKNNLLEQQKKVSPRQKKQENPNLEPLGSQMQNRVSVTATTTSSPELSKQDLNKKQLQSGSVKFPLAVDNVIHSASTSIGSVSSETTYSPAADNYEESLQRVQVHVALLIHAQKCQEGVNQANNTCSTRYCLKMKNHLSHVTLCQDEQSCQIPFCSYTKKIISHWSNCCLSDCPFCLGLRESNLPIDSQSNVLGATAQTVKPFSTVERPQAPPKLVGPLPRLLRAPSYQLNSIALMNKVRPATPPVIVSHETINFKSSIAVGREIQGVANNKLIPVGKDAVYTSNPLGDRPELQKFGKGDGETPQSNVLHPTTPSVLHPPAPISNVPASQNVAVGSGIQDNQAMIHTVGVKEHVTMSIGTDREKTGTQQQRVIFISQQPLIKKTEHLNFAIAMGGGVCCPVAALSRERLGKLLLDPAKFGCNFRTTLKNLLMEVQSPKVTKESRQKIEDFFGIHYLFVCSFFRKQCEKSGL